MQMRAESWTSDRAERQPSREEPRKQQPADDVLQRICLEDPRGTSETQRVGGPTEQNAACPIRRRVERTVDRRIPHQRFHRELRVELVARTPIPWRLVFNADLMEGQAVALWGSPGVDTDVKGAREWRQKAERRAQP